MALRRPAVNNNSENSEALQVTQGALVLKVQSEKEESKDKAYLGAGLAICMGWALKTQK